MSAKTLPDTDIRTRVQGELIVRVKTNDGAFITPSMSDDVKVIITRSELVALGLRLGNRSQVNP